MPLTRALLLGSLAFSAYASTASTLPKVDLTVLGPVYLPSGNGSAQAFVDAKAQAAVAIDRLVATSESPYGTFDNETTSFSASVFSTTTGEVLFEYHFEAPGLNGSLTKGKLTENTIYRTGSLGKLMVIYTWLVDIGDSVYTDPITKYVPELAAAAQSYKNPLLSTNWSEVTVGALASQISGIGRDFHLGDAAVESFQSPPVSAAVENGYPPVANSSIIPCNSYGGSLPQCSRAQFFEGLINHPPSFPSYTTPAYSNLAFVILGFAYETITGRTINDGQLDVLNKQLGMTSTTPTVPGDGADAIIPGNDSYAIWSYSLGPEDPAGGQYTSTKDLRTWGKAILQYTKIPGFITRRWMKPVTFTARYENAVGAPWEIYRTQLPINTIINASRIVDTYTKSGDVGLYSTFFGLVPDYNLGVSVLAAGENPTLQVFSVRATVVDAFYPAAEAAAKEHAKAVFPGTFKSPDRNSSITLAIDGGPGVVIQKWISNGTNFLDNLWLSSFDDFRLYPTLLSTKADDGLTYYKFHMSFLRNGGEPVTGDPWAPFNDFWIEVDNFDYNNLATDAFVIGFDEGGVVQSVSCQPLLTTMTRSA